jgi:hypothetical protein
MTNKCVGACCAEEYGDAGRPGRRVRVTGKDGMDWGVFTYCAEAIATDESRGFTVCDDHAVADRLDRFCDADRLYRSCGGGRLDTMILWFRCFQ